MNKRLAFLPALAFIASACSGGSSVTPPHASTPAPTLAPSGAPSATPTAHPTSSPTPTPTPVPTATPTPMPTATPLARASLMFVSENTQIAAFSALANGNVAPTAQFSTGDLLFAYRLAFGPNGKLWIANSGKPSLEEVDPADNGSVTALATIAGSNTQLNNPTGIAFDRAGNLYVADGRTGALLVFGAATLSGNVAPQAVVSSGLTGPGGVAIAANGSVYVSDQNTNPAKIAVYAANPTSSSNPTQEISGNLTGLLNPNAIAFDGQGNLYVADSGGTGMVLVFAPGASGNVAPIRTITGANTLLQNPNDVAVDALGYVYVADNTGVRVFAPNANGNVAPVQAVSGSNTTLNSALGIALR